jgi:transaldolase
VRASLNERTHHAEATLAAAARLGLDVHALTEQLQTDGVNAFAASFEQLLTTVDHKRQAIAAVAH